MKKLFFIIVVFFVLLTTTAAFAGWVRGYSRRDGTYVEPYYRTNPDSNPYNNRGYYESNNPDGYINDYYGWD